MNDKTPSLAGKATRKNRVQRDQTGKIKAA
jgi:hypothetical protein